jgi:hypothetical protein
MKRALTITVLAVLALTGTALAQDVEPVAIGSRLELMVDDYLIETLSGGAAFRMHRPIPREVVLDHNEPWEGSGTGYHTVFQDGPLYRMYYKAWHLDVQESWVKMPHDTVAAYAQSVDGMHWVKPELGLFEYEGTKDNNIVWMGKGSHDFTPFKDTRPGCPPDELYKAAGYGDGGLYGFKSADGIHWSLIQEGPIMTGYAFDTQNLVFWDSVRKEYRAYVRDFSKSGYQGIRGIRTATSKDFITWTEAQWLEYVDSPVQQLYTNQVKPYYRAPHIFIGFPTRYMERGWSPSMEALPNLEHRRMRSKGSDRYGMAISEGLLMTSRDGVLFNRWNEAFLPPGIERADNWAYGDNYLAWHVVETESAMKGAPKELSLYATESYWTGNSSTLRRYTLRIDGFVSIEAPFSGGEVLTKPLVFEGDQLVLNFATSAAGSIRVEVQSPDGQPIEGFALDDCHEIFGDALSRPVIWKDASVGSLAGRPVRLRFVMSDADLYSLQFRKNGE